MAISRILKPRYCHEVDTPILMHSHDNGTFEWRALREGDYLAIGGPAFIRLYAGEKVYGLTDDGDAEDPEAEDVEDDRTVVVLDEEGEFTDIDPHLFNVTTRVAPWKGSDFFEIEGKLYRARSPFS